MQEKADELRERTKSFAVSVVRFARTLQGDAVRALGRQLIRSGTAVGANYGAACLARSRAEFAAKIGVVTEEADETVYWLEVALRSGIGSREPATALLCEARELRAIFLASYRTARKNLNLKP